MKSYRKTIVLIGLFFTSLLVLLGLELGGIYSGNERRLRESRILPDLINTPEATIHRVSVERGQWEAARARSNAELRGAKQRESPRSRASR